MARIDGGFKIKDSEGGYYDYGQTVVPLRNGSASFVIYANGTVTVAEWDATPSWGRTLPQSVKNCSCSSTTANPCRA